MLLHICTYKIFKKAFKLQWDRPFRAFPCLNFNTDNVRTEEARSCVLNVSRITRYCCKMRILAHRLWPHPFLCVFENAHFFWMRIYLHWILKNADLKEDFRKLWRVLKRIVFKMLRFLYGHAKMGFFQNSDEKHCRKCRLHLQRFRSFWCGLVIVENRLYEAEGKSFWKKIHLWYGIR